MSYYVRMMSAADVAQVTEIDREAFPTQWPPPDYKRELKSRLSHYVVACDVSRESALPEVQAPPEKEPATGRSLWGWLLRRQRLVNNAHTSPDQHGVIGFVGLWIVSDEAHITSIAVRETYRRQGIGELLLITAIGLAAELKARLVTLEVRASNTTAQNLYAKYGFNRVGLRRGYYIDNREDAVLMTVEDVTSAAYQAQLERLKQDCSRKLGITTFQINQGYLSSSPRP